MQVEIRGLKQVSNKLTTKLSNVESKDVAVEEDLDQLDIKFKKLQTLVENTDSSKKYNIHLHGLKEEVEGRDLVEFLKAFKNEHVRSDLEISVQIVTAYHI